MAAPRYVEGKFANRRRQQLFYCALFPADVAPRALVLFLHGVGEHSRRFLHVYERLCALGYGVLAYDMVAHGQSDCDSEHQVRGHGERFEHFVDDTNVLLSLARLGLLQPSLPAVDVDLANDLGSLPPLVIMGISFGALVAMHTVLSGKHAFRAAVLASPAVAVEYTLTLQVQQAVSRPLVWLLPRAKLVPGVNFSMLSRDEEFVRDYLADPLNVTDSLTTTMATQILAGMQALQSDPRVRDPSSAFCQVPMLVVQGTSDHVTSVRELERFFYDVLAAPDKTLRRFDGLYHCLFNEPEREQVLDAITDWLARKVPRRMDEQPRAELLHERAEAARLQARL
jgi:acylglycerol lipase